MTIDERLAGVQNMVESVAADAQAEAVILPDVREAAEEPQATLALHLAEGLWEAVGELAAAVGMLALVVKDMHDYLSDLQRESIELQEVEKR